MKKPQKSRRIKTAKKEEFDMAAWKRKWEEEYEKNRKGGRFIWEEGIC